MRIGLLPSPSSSPPPYFVHYFPVNHQLLVERASQPALDSSAIKACLPAKTAISAGGNEELTLSTVSYRVEMATIGEADMTSEAKGPEPKNSTNTTRGFPFFLPTRTKKMMRIAATTLRSCPSPSIALQEKEEGHV